MRWWSADSIGPGFGALLVDKTDAGFPVQAQCVSRPAAPVQSRHLVGDQCLVQRVLSEQLAKLADQVGMPAKLKLALDALQDCPPALLLETVAHPPHPVAAALPASAWPRQSPSASRSSEAA